MSGIIGNIVGTFRSVSETNYSGYAVRPVVYLQPRVTVKDLLISSNGSEEAWTTTPLFGYNTLEGSDNDYGKITE